MWAFTTRRGPDQGVTWCQRSINYQEDKCPNPVFSGFVAERNQSYNEESGDDGRRVGHGRRVLETAEGGGCVQIDISTRHGHLSEASQKKIEAKVIKITRIFDRLTSIHLTVDLEHEHMPSVDLRVSAEHKHDFVSSDRGTDLMGSIDSVVHRIESQLRKYKEKIQQRHRTESEKEMLSETDAENLDRQQ